MVMAAMKLKMTFAPWKKSYDKPRQHIKKQKHFFANKVLSSQTCILSRVKEITSPGWMYETSAQAWCTGKTQWDWVEREVGGGIGMGNTCKSMADSCQCMTRTTAIL